MMNDTHKDITRRFSNLAQELLQVGQEMLNHKNSQRDDPSDAYAIQMAAQGLAFIARAQGIMMTREAREELQESAAKFIKNAGQQLL